MFDWFCRRGCKFLWLLDLYISHMVLGMICRFGCVKWKTRCVNPKSCVQSAGHVGKNWVCICKFGCVKHSLHGWLAKSLISHDAVWSVVKMSNLHSTEHLMAIHRMQSPRKLKGGICPSRHSTITPGEALLYRWSFLFLLVCLFLFFLNFRHSKQFFALCDAFLACTYIRHMIMLSHGNGDLYCSLKQLLTIHAWP